MDVLGDMILSEAGYDDKEVVYGIDAYIEVPDGIYMADVVVESVSPMSFLTNNQ